MKGIVLVVVMAVLVEAFIEYAKSFIKMVSDGEIKTAITQVIAVVAAVALCMAAGADLFAALGIAFAFPWIGIVLTGILISRGANYMSDFIKRLQNVKGGA